MSVATGATVVQRAPLSPRLIRELKVLGMVRLTATTTGDVSGGTLTVSVVIPAGQQKRLWRFVGLDITGSKLATVVAQVLVYVMAVGQTYVQRYSLQVAGVTTVGGANQDAGYPLIHHALALLPEFEAQATGTLLTFIVPNPGAGDTYTVGLTYLERDATPLR